MHSYTGTIKLPGKYQGNYDLVENFEKNWKHRSAGILQLCITIIIKLMERANNRKIIMIVIHTIKIFWK